MVEHACALAGEDDELATVAPLRALRPDVAARRATPADPATTARIERAPDIGRPLGRPEWVAVLERRLDRRFGSPQTRPKAASGARHRTAGASAVKHTSKLSPQSRRNPVIREENDAPGFPEMGVMRHCMHL